jgi:hypothetical protein
MKYIKTYEDRRKPMATPDDIEEIKKVAHSLNNNWNNEFSKIKGKIDRLDFQDLVIEYKSRGGIVGYMIPTRFYNFLHLTNDIINIISSFSDGITTVNEVDEIISIESLDKIYNEEPDRFLELYKYFMNMMLDYSGYYKKIFNNPKFQFLIDANKYNLL